MQVTVGLEVKRCKQRRDEAVQVLARCARVVERVFAHSDRGDTHRVGVERHERDEGAVRVHAVLTDEFVVHREVVTDDGEATTSGRDDSLGSVIDDLVGGLVDLFENRGALVLEISR